MSSVLLSGASGFIGSHLAKALAADGHRVLRLARDRGGAAGTVYWDPESGSVDRAQLERAQADAVVNLAGEPIAQRWTAAARRRIRESRVRGTTVLAEALAALSAKPTVLVSGSAIGYYGAHRGDELLDESSVVGADFLATTSLAWEEATQPAANAGIRVAMVRTGLVLGEDGGVLARMLPPFRSFVGGRLGDGQQWMSWIAIEDMVRAIRFAIETATLRGPLNLVAPEPVRNEEFTRILARVLDRPAVIPLPAFALRAIFGEMADNTIFASQRVIPKRLAGAGFQFRHPRLEDALRALLRR